MRVTIPVGDSKAVWRWKWTATVAPFMAIVFGCGSPVESPPAAKADVGIEHFVPEAIHVGESAPVSLNGLQFSVVAQTNWRPLKPPTSDHSLSDDLEIHLRVLNLTREPIVFPTFDTFRIVIKNADGTIIRMGGGRDWTEFTAPIMIPPGVGFSISRKAVLKWNNPKVMNFLYFDGTGNVQSIPNFTSPGNYKISFQIASGHRRTRIHEVVQDVPVGEIRAWQGAVAWQGP